MFIEVFYEIVGFFVLVQRYRKLNESVGYKVNSEYILYLKEGGGFENS